MELGQRIRQARQEAGLSQRQLCGDVITRNMLSQIENGSAHPSMDTLQFLARGLGKPISWFLEEEQRSSDEQQLQQTLSALDQARLCLEEGRLLRARQLLEELPADLPYQALTNRNRLLLLWKAGGITAVEAERQLPDLDEELLLRAAAALARQDFIRAGQLLDAAQEQGSVDWLALRAEAWFGQKAYREAIGCFSRIEDVRPRQAFSRLEECWRELEEYKQAYFYACRLREMK